MAGKSTVASLIDFDADEEPKWRTDKSRNVPSVREMIRDIVKYQSKWEKEKKTIDQKAIEKIQNDFLVRFIFHVNIEEEHGYGTLEDVEECLSKTYSRVSLKRHLSVEETETINLKKAYDFLLNELKEVSYHKDLHGLLETDILAKAHKLILKDVKLPTSSTKAGEFSRNRRYTCFEGERYEYQNPEDMEKTVCTVIDRYNDLLNSIKSEDNSEERVYKIFKTCAWMLFELLDVHPFSDGNGRLCRLLCSYALSFMTPFATPIYNIWSESSKHDYKRALVDARKSSKRHPKSLTSMIIECNWYGWKEFNKHLQKNQENIENVAPQEVNQ